ncbi:triphosphoribosyl-dephospho-CoA synthase [Anopheles sinensis]|uniref:Triphosphoribosyl-dephospho-CoA synthase n=1 Tax=Anopheles sinensis TaxID=74873 RepID=A0A084VMF5_ANOSI|nr:triphosphoribosyl-dephospho-CoA synthase [Anopheles sinensis]
MNHHRRTLARRKFYHKYPINAPAVRPFSRHGIEWRRVVHHNVPLAGLALIALCEDKTLYGRTTDNADDDRRQRLANA